MRHIRGHFGSKPSVIQPLERRLFLDSTLIHIGDDAAIAYDDVHSALYVAPNIGNFSSGSDELDRYDVTARRLTEPFKLNFTPAGMDVSVDGKFLYAMPDRFSNGGVGEIYRIDVESGATQKTTFTAPEAVGGQALVVAANGAVIFAVDRTSWGEPMLRQFDPSTGVVSDFVGTNGDQHVIEYTSVAALTRSADRQRLLFSYHKLDRRAAVLDGQSLQPLSDVVFQDWFDAPIALSPDAALLAGKKTVVDANLNLVQNIEPAGDQIRTVAFDPERPRLYVLIGKTYAPRLQLAVYDTDTWQKLLLLPLEDNEYFDDIIPTSGGNTVLLTGDSGMRVVPLTTSPTVSVTPAYARSNVPRTISVSMRNPNGEPTEWSGTLRFASDDATATLPPDTPVTLASGQVLTFTATFPTHGDYSLDVLDASTGAFGRAKVEVDDTGPQASLWGGSPPDKWEPGGPFRVGVTIYDDFHLDQVTVDDPDTELVAIAPDGIPHDITYGFIDHPYTPDYMCSGDCQLDYNNYGFYPHMRGTYVLRMTPGSAADTLGNVATGGEIGTFRVESFGGGDAVYGTEDLTVALATVPPQFGKRPTVTGALVVSNEGPVRGKGVSRITVSLVSDSNPSAMARHLRTWKQSLKLDPGKSRRLKVRLPMPADLPDGTYHLVAKVGPLSGFERVEPNDANNTAVSEPFLLRPVVGTGAANLLVTPSATSKGLQSGRLVSMTARLYNAGSAATNGQFALSILASTDTSVSGSKEPVVDRLLFSIVTPVRLKPGAADVLPIEFTVPDGLIWDTYAITATIVPAI